MKKDYSTFAIEYYDDEYLEGEQSLSGIYRIEQPFTENPHLVLKYPYKNKI
mgnify:CR=1 FL=1